MLGRGHEYMDLEPDGPDEPALTGASQRGFGPAGRAGTIRDGGAHPTGLISATTPMVPNSWPAGAG